MVMPDGTLVPTSAFAELPDPWMWQRRNEWQRIILVHASPEPPMIPLDGEAVPIRANLLTLEFRLQEAIDNVGHSVWYWQYEQVHSGNAEKVHRSPGDLARTTVR